MTSVESRVAHHSAGVLIIRRILDLWAACDKLDAWGGNNTVGWHSPKGRAFNVGAERICDEFRLDNATWHEFCRQAYPLFKA